MGAEVSTSAAADNGFAAASVGGGGGGGGGGTMIYPPSGDAAGTTDPYKAGRRGRRRRRPSGGSSSSSTATSPAQSSPHSAGECGGQLRRKHFKRGEAQVGESGDTAAASYSSVDDDDDEQHQQEGVEVIAPCRSAREEDDLDLVGSYSGDAGGGNHLRGGPTMTRPTISAYSPSPPSSGQPVCWGWLPRSLTAQSSVPAISVVSDESGGSNSTNSTTRDGVGSWLYGRGYSGSGCGGDAAAPGTAPQHLRVDGGDRVVGAAARDEGDDTPRTSHHGGTSGAFYQDPALQGFAPPAHPLSSDLGVGDSFLVSRDSEEVATPPFPPAAPISGRKSSRRAKSSKKSIKPKSKSSSSRRSQPQQQVSSPQEQAQQEQQESADCHGTCMPQNCLPSFNQDCLPGQPGQQSHVPDITCGVGELAQANWEALTAQQQQSQQQPQHYNTNQHHQEQLQAQPQEQQWPQSPGDLAKLRHRDELLASASRCEMSGDHSSALQCYERCLTEYHRHSFAPARASGPNSSGNPMSSTSGGAPVDVVVVPCSASVEVADVLHRIGVVHWKSGGYDESVRVLRESLAVYRRHLRPDISRTFAVVDDATGKELKVNVDADALAGILNSLGRVHLSRGECGSSMRAYQESLSIQEAVYADPSDLEGECDDVSTGTGVTFDTTHTGFTSKLSMASSTAAPSTLSAAQSFSSKKSTKSKSRATKRALSTHPLIARTVIAIGQVYDARGNYAKSLRRYKSGLKAQRQSLGPDHVDVAATLNSMGLAQERLGRHDVAERCYEEALRIYRLNLGDGHVDTAVALNNLGQVHHHNGQYDAATGCYVDALRIMRAVLGDSHRNVAATLHNVGLVHSARGKYDKALKIYREVLRAQRAALGDGHVDVAVTLDSIASAYEGKGRYDRSRKFYAKALRVRRSALGKRHPFVAVTLHRMGRFHVDCDHDWIEAERRLGEAREIYLETNGDDENGPRVVEVDEYLGRCRRERAHAPLPSPPAAAEVHADVPRSTTPSRDDESDGEE